MDLSTEDTDSNYPYFPCERPCHYMVYKEEGTRPTKAIKVNKSTHHSRSMTYRSNHIGQGVLSMNVCFVLTGPRVYIPVKTCDMSMVSTDLKSRRICITVYYHPTIPKLSIILVLYRSVLYLLETCHM